MVVVMMLMVMMVVVMVMFRGHLGCCVSCNTNERRYSQRG